MSLRTLYTNIPHNEGINACDHFLRSSSHNTIPTGTLCDLIRMILTMNNFSFNDNHYLQIHGTAAMGTKMAVRAQTHAKYNESSSFLKLASPNKR